MKKIIQPHLCAIAAKWKKRLAPLVALEVGFEICIVFLKFDLFAFLVEHVTETRIGLILSGLAIVIDAYGINGTGRKRKKGDGSLEEQEEDDTRTIYAKAWSFLKDAYQSTKKSQLASFLLTIVVLGLVPSAAAHYVRPFGSTINGIAEFVEQMRYDSAEDSIPQVVVDEDAEELIAASSNQVELEQEPQTITPRFLEDPERYYELSDEERRWLYFKTNLYKVDDWNNDATMIDVVSALIQDLRSQKASNEFDDYAPADVQKSVAEAKTDYSKMLSSVELDETINVQLMAWSEYPKYGLAWLLANDFQEYGDRYNQNNGYFETIEYYYAQSIFWAWRSLSYESATSYQVKECLRYISMRYHDIADIAPEGSQVKIQAAVLSRAFEAIENVEFSQ